MGFDGTHSIRPPEPDGAPLRILTINLGLLGLNGPLGLRLPFAAALAARLAAAPRLLSALDADIIALQEVYGRRDRRRVARALSARFPYHADAPRRRSLMGNGLMVLSRYPIVDAAFLPCRGASVWAALLWSPGFLAVDIDVPVIGRMRLINVHLAASIPFAHPESSVSVSHRHGEIGELLACARGDAREDTPATILVGDFNTSPDICPDNYRRIIEAGYADAFSESNTAAAEACTWHPANPLNARGRYQASPSQRIDHVFVHTRSTGLAPMNADVVLKDDLVCTASGAQVPLSDHYGLLATLASGSTSLATDHRGPGIAAGWISGVDAVVAAPDGR